MTRLASFVDVLCTQMLASHGIGYATSGVSTLENIVDEHAGILAAIKSGDVGAAETSMSDHFQPVEPMLEAYQRLVEERANAADGS